MTRLLLSTFALSAIAWTQGVSTRAVKPLPRGKPSGLPFPTKFVDVAAEAGLTHRTVYGSDDRKQYILETVGCGVAFIDYDRDGWLDIFLLSGTRLEGPAPGVTNRLYRNERNGKFTDVTAKAGLIRQGWAGSVTAGDYDNNGFLDLFVTYYGQNVLYRNNGDGTFTDVTEAAGLLRKETHWGGGAAFFDMDRDGDLDLFVANYLLFDPEKVPKPGQSANCNWKGVPVNCGPRGLPPDRHVLYRNDGDGKFVDISDGLRNRQGERELRDDRGGCRSRQRRLARPLRRLRLDAQLLLPQQSRRHVHRVRSRARHRAQRRRHGAGRHGNRSRRLQSRRTSRHFQDALRRRHQRALSQRRQGQFRRRDDLERPRRRDALHRLGRRHRGPR